MQRGLRHHRFLGRLAALGGTSLILSSLLLSFGAAVATAADTGAKLPGATTTPNGWTGGGNALADDGVLATATADDADQGYRDFGFGLPAGSIVDGITVKAEASSTDGSGCQLQFRASYNGGSSWTGYQTMDLTSTATTLTAGGASSDWGHVWDPTQLENDQFRLQMRNNDPGQNCTNGSTTSVDWVSLTITYRTVKGGTSNPALAKGVCNEADFDFVIDMSGSIGVQDGNPSNLPQLQAGITGFVDAFAAAGGNGIYSGTRFNGTSASAMTSGYDSAASFKSKVNALSGPTGTTPTAAGIDTGAANSAGDRAGVPNVLFVVTDGSPNVPGGNLSDPPTWLQAANAAVDSADAARAGGYVVKAVYLSTAGDPGDTTLPFSSAGDAQWAKKVMQEIGGGSYLDADFKSFVDDLFAAIHCSPPPTVKLTKSVDDTSKPEPGGDFHFTLTIHNTSDHTVKITKLTDDNPLSQACNDLVGTSLKADESVSCTYTVTHDKIGTYPNEASVTVEDSDGGTASDKDHQSVAVTDILPVVKLDKTVTPSSRPEPGGAFAFTLTITNTSKETEVITALTDDNALSAECLDLIGDSLAPGDSTSCTYSVTHTNAGTYDNTAEVTVADDEKNTAKDKDSASVEVTDVAPTITVDKTAEPTSLPEPGGTFTFKVKVTNTSIETVTDHLAHGRHLRRPERQGHVRHRRRPGSERLVQLLVPRELRRERRRHPDRLGHREGRRRREDPGHGQGRRDGPPDRRPPDDLRRQDGDAADATRAGGLVHLRCRRQEHLVREGDHHGPLGRHLRRPRRGRHLRRRRGPRPGCLVHLRLREDVHRQRRRQPDGRGPAAAIDDDGSTATDTDDATVKLTDVKPTIEVDKTASPTVVDEPGGDVSFTVKVKNTSFEPVTLDSLVDDVHGDLNGKGSCATGGSIAPGATYTCSFSAHVAGNAGDFETDVVEATASDDDQNSVKDHDDATVTILNVDPSVRVIKDASPATRPEPGGSFKFDIQVINDSHEKVTLISLTDDIYGDLDGQGDCATGATLDADGGTYTCSFGGSFIGDAGDKQTDIVTATVVDDDKDQKSGFDDATVSLTDVPPTVSVDKTASPDKVEAGTEVTFTVKVTNTSKEPVSLDSLTDSIHGNLDGQGTCVADGSVQIAAGATYTCDFTAVVNETETDVVTATVSDNEKNHASDEDDATVTVADLLIDKSVTNGTADRGTTKDGWVIANPGDALHYTLAYSMTNGPLHGVVITDVLPEGLGAPSNISDGGTWDAGTRTLTWELGTVESDGVVTYDVVVAVGANKLEQPLENIATIDSDETGPRRRCRRHEGRRRGRGQDRDRQAQAHAAPDRHRRIGRQP